MQDGISIEFFVAFFIGLWIFRAFVEKRVFARLSDDNVWKDMLVSLAQILTGCVVGYIAHLILT